jgi:hypothetical protein
MSTYTPATLESVKNHGYRLIANCEACGMGRDIDVELLIDRLSPQYQIPAINKLLRCVGCGAREGSLRIISRS